MRDWNGNTVQEFYQETSQDEEAGAPEEQKCPDCY